MTFSRMSFGLFVVASAIAVGCSSSSSSGSASASLAFHAEAPALPGFSYETGLQPASGPAQMSLTLVAAGNVLVDAAATANGGTVTGKPGGGKLALDVHVKLTGRLKVDAGTVKYDGPIPGLAGIDVPIGGSQSFDGLLLDGAPAVVSASLPETKLPDVPLGTVPGHLSITVAAGSKLTTSFKGTCVEIHGGKATYTGETTTSGTLVLRSQLVLDIPLVKPLDLPETTVPIPSSAKPLVSAPVDAAGAADSTTGACPASAGDGGAADGDSGSVGTGEAGTSDDASPADKACGALGTKDDCNQCCANAHATGNKALSTLYDACLCSAPGQCQGVCGSNYCANPSSATAECLACAGSSTCDADSRTQCVQNGGECAAYLSCTSGQACASKP